MKYREHDRPVPNDDLCGTINGWYRHYRHGEGLCDACRRARTQYRQDRKFAPIRRAILDAEVAIFEKRRRSA